MKIGFRADNDLDRDIVRGLLRLEPNIDFEAEPLNGLDDDAVLLIALRKTESSLHTVSAPFRRYFSGFAKTASFRACFSYLKTTQSERLWNGLHLIWV
jgi:hypothetical protein